MLKTILTFTFALMLVGCASLPESVKGQSESPVTEYSEVANYTNENQGQEVRLGGVIASVKNFEDASQVEIVSLPISKAGRPEPDNKIQGRFIAVIDGLADPVAFAEGRLITVVGNYERHEAGKVGEYPYDYPVIKANGHQLWNLEQRVIMDDDYPYRRCYGGYCPRFNFGFGISTGRIHTVVTP